MQYLSISQEGCCGKDSLSYLVRGGLLVTLCLRERRDVMRERSDFAECKAIGGDGWTSKGMQIVQKGRRDFSKGTSSKSTVMECVLCPFEEGKNVLRWERIA
jgi:hypothetical protein